MQLGLIHSLHLLSQPCLQLPNDSNMGCYSVGEGLVSFFFFFWVPVRGRSGKAGGRTTIVPTERASAFHRRSTSKLHHTFSTIKFCALVFSIRTAVIVPHVEGSSRIPQFDQTKSPSRTLSEDALAIPREHHLLPWGFFVFIETVFRNACRFLGAAEDK